jgi:hypothetical protein
MKHRTLARAFIPVFFLTFAAMAAFAQKQAPSPTDAAINFYRSLKGRHYVEGFRHSVYRGAVEGLTADELRELEPDFAITFSSIPDKIEAQGEQVTGDVATVFLKFGGQPEVQSVALVRVGGEWLVGDADSLSVVSAQGRSFFFNARILVNEADVAEMLTRIIGAEIIYSRKYEGRNAPLADLIRLGAVPKDMEDEEASGYRFALALSEDQKTFSVTATPVKYGKTGRLSFYADINGVRGEDLKGGTAGFNSPVYQPK